MTSAKESKFIKPITLFLIVFMIQLPLAARKARRGATVEVRLTDGGLLRGELLAVKEHEILVFDPYGQQGKNLSVDRIHSVRVIKESKALLGLAIGAAVGLAYSSIYSIGHGSGQNGWNYLFVTPLFGLPGTIVGSLIGTDRHCILTNISPENRARMLKSIKRYAREPMN